MKKQSDYVSFNVPVVLQVMTKDNLESAKSYVTLFLNGELEWDDASIVSWSWPENAGKYGGDE